MKKYSILFFIIFTICLVANPSVNAKNEQTNLMAKKPILLKNITWGGDDIMTFSMFNSTNGFLYICGQRNNSYGFMLKYDHNCQFIRNWSWKQDNISTFIGGCCDSKGNIYAIGLSELNTFLMKFNVTGDMQWIKRIKTETSFSSITFFNNSIYLTGAIDLSAFESKALLSRYDTYGNPIWNQTWHGGVADVLAGIVIDNNTQNIYTAGSTHKPTGTSPADVLIIKYLTNGKEIWNKTWNSPSSANDVGLRLTVSDSNEIYISGQSGNNLLLLKYTTDGNYIWDVIGGSTYYYAEGIALNSSNEIYVAGRTSTLYSLVVKYDKSKTEIWNDQWRNSSMDAATAKCIYVNSTGEIFVAGQCGIGGDHNYVFLLKYKEIEVNTPEFITIILPTIAVITIFIVITKRRKKD